MKKGQYLTVEQMMIFMVGVIITIWVFFMFSNIKNQIKEGSTDDQLYLVGEHVLSGIVQVFSSGEGNETLIMKIPEKVSGEQYSIKIVEGRIKLSSAHSQKSVNVSLLGMNEDTNIRGYAFSSKKELKIIYENKTKILIGR